ncbi:MAG: hypothetical protein JNM17_30675 [Archangium sp.]|nr:hypothetical protein [Archangium sp.]
MSTNVDMKGVAKGALLGGLGAGVVGIALYFVGAALGADFKLKDPASMGGVEVMPPYQPLVPCLMAAVASIIVVAILKKVAPARAWNIYVGIAVVVFLLELYFPFTAFADLKTILTLEVMHIPASLGIVLGIKKFGFVAASPT